MTEAMNIAIPDIIFLELKTSGIYLKADSIDSTQQPWAPYIAAMQCTNDGRIVNHFSAYIKDDGRRVKVSATMEHGIDHKLTSRIGIPESRALGMLGDFLKIGPFDTHQRIVTFGDMDPMVISSLFSRFAVSLGKQSHAFDKLWFSRPLTEFVDIQKPFCQQVCKLDMPPAEPGSTFAPEGYKWPTFEEAAIGVLGRDVAGKRDALSDLLTLKDMYFELRRRGLFIEREAA